MISYLYAHAVVVAVTGCCIFAVLCLVVAIKFGIDGFRRMDDGRHTSGDHEWLRRYNTARHAYQAAVTSLPGPEDQPGPRPRKAETLRHGTGRAGEPLIVPGPDVPPAGPGTLLPVAYYSGRTEGQQQLLWPSPISDDTSPDLPAIAADVPLPVQYGLGARNVDEAIEQLFGFLKPGRAA